MTTQLALDPAIAAHIAAINSADLDAIMDTFAEDALVNDVSREFWGHDHIRAWVAKEMVGDHVTLEPIEVAERCHRRLRPPGRVLYGAAEHSPGVAEEGLALRRSPFQAARVKFSVKTRPPAWRPCAPSIHRSLRHVVREVGPPGGAGIGKRVEHELAPQTRRRHR